MSSFNAPAENRYRLLFETMKQGVLHQNREGWVTHANPAAEKILGTTFDELKEMNPENLDWKLFSEDGTPITVMDHPALIALKTGEEVLDSTIGILKPDLDRLIWINIDAIPLFSEGENYPYEVYSLFEDITDRKNLEISHKRSERMFRNMAESINDVFWIMDLDLNFIYVSPSIQKLTGFTPEEYIENGLHESICKEDLQDVLEAITKGLEEERKGLFLEGDSRRMEFRMVRKNGELVWGEVIATLMRDEDGNLKGISGVTRDISEKKSYEEELSRSETKYRHLFESAGDAIMITKFTEDGPRFIECNRKAEYLFGAGNEELLKMDPVSLSPPEQQDGTPSRELIMNNMERLMAGETVHVEWIHRKTDGTDFPCEVTLSGNIIDGENVIQAIVRDITERREAESELNRSRNELDLFFRSSLDLFAIADTDGFFRKLNPEWERTLGYSVKDMEGTRFIDYVHPEDKDLTVEAVSELKESGSILNFVNRYGRKDGTYRWIEWRSHLVGNLIYAAARDITENKMDSDRMKVLTELLDSAPTTITVHDFDGNFLYSNRKNLELHGMERDEFLGKKLEDIDTPRSRDHINERMEKLREEGEVSFEVEHLRKDGSSLPLSIHAKLANWGDKQVLLSIGSDITDKRKAEEALKQSEERYRILVENALETILVAQDSRIKFINKAGGDLAGVPAEEMTGRPFLEFIHPDDRRKVGESYRKRMKGEILPKYSFRVLREDGSIRWAEIEAVSIEWEGKPATLNFISDVTERKIAEIELKKSEEWHRALIDISPDPILIYDLEGNLTFASGQTKNLYGIDSTEEFLGEIKNIGDLLNEADREKAFLNFNKVLENGRSTGNEYSIRIRDGSEIRIEVNSSVLRDPSGKPISFISIIRDITEQKKSRELIEWERNRAEFYLDLLSHDIGNIHQGLQAWTGILRARSNDEMERKRALMKIDELGKRSIKLVRNVLLLSRLKDMKSDLSPVNLIPLIKKTVRDIRSLFIDRDLKISVSQGFQTVNILAEPVIEEIFFNLLHNGIKFQYEDPVRIEIDIDRFRREGVEFFKISFADHGIGVSDDKKDHLFDRHIKGSDYGYSGIGLSLVKELVTRYKGYMEVRDRIDGNHSKGAVFIINLPASDP